MTSAGARAADLISKVSKDFFIAAAQNTASSMPASTMGDNEDQEESAVAEVVEDEIFEVDEILDTKLEGRKRMFLVRWKNYGEEADSWEPESMLRDGAADTVEEFMANHRKKTGTAAKGKRGRRPSKVSTKRSSKRSSKSAEHVSEKDATTAEEESEAESEESDSGFGPKSKKLKVTPKKSVKGKNNLPEQPPKLTPKAMNLNKTPWFMDSSSDSDTEKRPSPPPELDIPSPSVESTPSNGTIPKIKIKQPSLAVSFSATPTSTPHVIADSNKNDDKKSKKDKHKKKHKRKLIFEGIFRKTRGEGLFFAVKGADDESEPTVMPAEEAIETDSRSLARFLCDKIVFSEDGMTSIN